MFRSKKLTDPDSAWKLQNKEQKENPVYQYINLQQQGKLVDIYREKGEEGLENLIHREIKRFLYNDGHGKVVSKVEYIRWKDQITAKMNDATLVDTRTDDEVLASYETSGSDGGGADKRSPSSAIEFREHEACWALNQRGSVGETALHLCMLFSDIFEFREISQILLRCYPKLALDFYEGDEYYGESGLHIAIVYGDFDLVRQFVSNGAYVHQRALGRFFLPEDQKSQRNEMTNYEGYAYYGEYPLAFAACFGHEEIYDYLIDHEADPNLQDSFGNTVLHMMVIKDQANLFSYAVKHPMRSADIQVLNHQHLTPLTLASKMGRMEVFNSIIELQSYEIWRYSNIKCSVYPLAPLDTIGPQGEPNYSSALHYITEGDSDDHLAMLDDGIVKQLLADKWKRYASRRFLERLLVASLHLVTLSVAIYTRPYTLYFNQPDPIDTITVVRYVAEAIVCVDCVGNVIMQLVEIRSQGVRGFIKHQTSAPAKFIFNISCILIILCIPMRFFNVQTAERVLVAFAAPCSWAFLLFFARVFNFSGVVLVVFYQILIGDLRRFGIIYLIFLALFGQSFFFFYKTADTTSMETFKTVDGAFMKLFQMTLGEYQGVYESFNSTPMPNLSKFVFVIFAIFVPILLLNMLIAMFVHTYEQIIRRSEKEWKRQWAKIIIVLERTFSREQLLGYQADYSVQFGSSDARGLMVIKTSIDTRARQRKNALANWRRATRIIKRIIKGENDLQQQRNGQGPSSEDNRGLLAAMKQLAWEKDIDLNKGGVAPPVPPPAPSSKPPAAKSPTPEQPRGSQPPVAEGGKTRGPVRGWARTPSPGFRCNKVGAAELVETDGGLVDEADVPQSKATPAKRKRRRKLRRRAKQTSRVASEKGETAAREGDSVVVEEGTVRGVQRVAVESSMASLQSDASSRTSLIPRRED